MHQFCSVRGIQGGYHSIAKGTYDEDSQRIPTAMPPTRNTQQNDHPLWNGAFFILGITLRYILWAMHTHNHDHAHALECSMVANMMHGVASAFHGETHTMGGYPCTVETCNWYIYMYILAYIFVYEYNTYECICICFSLRKCYVYMISKAVEIWNGVKQGC